MLFKEKNNQQNISGTVFINSGQPLQFIYSA